MLVGASSSVLDELLNECEHLRGKVDKAEQAGTLSTGQTFRDLIKSLRRQLKLPDNESPPNPLEGKANDGVTTLGSQAVGTEPSLPCTDDNRHCVDWAKDGHCVGKYEDKMKVQCRLSCKFCVSAKRDDIAESESSEESIDEDAHHDSSIDLLAHERTQIAKSLSDAVYLNVDEEASDVSNEDENGASSLLSSNLETDADTPHFDREASSVAQSPQRTFSSAQEDNLRSEFKSVLERTAVEKASEQGDNEDSFIIEAQDSASEGSDLIDNLTDRWHTTSTISDERPHLDTDDIPEEKLENSQTEKAYTATAEGDGFSNEEQKGKDTNDYDEEEDDIIQEEQEKRQEFSRESDGEEQENDNEATEKYYESEELDVAKVEDLTVSKDWATARRDFEEHNTGKDTRYVIRMMRKRRLCY